MESFTGDVGVDAPEGAIDGGAVEAVDSFEGFVCIGGEYGGCDGGDGLEGLEGVSGAVCARGGWE